MKGIWDMKKVVWSEKAGRFVLALVITALFTAGMIIDNAAPVAAQIVVGADAYDYEAVTVTATATRLAAAKVSPTGELSGKIVIITTETADVRYRYDGTDPTTTEGHLAVSGSTLVVTGINNIRRLRFIRTAATSATLRVTYLR